jgi:hypothetical protein
VSLRALLAAGLAVLVAAVAWWCSQVPTAVPLASGSERGEQQVDAALARGRLDAGRAERSLPHDAVERQLDVTWSLQVRVVDAHDDGVAGARVEVRSQRGGEVRCEGVCDETGAARIDVQGDAVWVRARDADVGASLERSVGRTDRSCTLALRRPVRMHGYAFGVDGQPLVDARVAIRTGEEGIVAQFLGGDEHVPAVPATMRTDAAGGFAFEVAAGWSGVARVEIDSADGWPDTGTVAFTAGEGGEVLVGLPGAFVVRGVVVDGRGEVVEAVVEVHAVDGRHVLGDYRRAGRDFQIGIAPGKRIRLVARADQGEGYADVVATRSDPQPRVVIRLGEGRATEPPFRAIPDGGVDVVATLPDGSAPPALRHRWVDVTFERSLGDLHREEGGSFHLGHAPKPPARLWVKSRAGEVATWVVPAGPLPRRVELRLQKPVDVEISVLHRGRPARGLDVTLLACGTRETFALGPSGVATFTWICPGPAKAVVTRGWEVVGEQQLFLAASGSNRATVHVDLSR